MSFIRQSVYTLIIQGLGPLSMLVLSIWIIKTQGAAAQGQFATMRALIDMIVSIGLFGMPQSIVLLVNRERCSRRIVYDWAIKYGFFVFFFGVVAILISPTWRSEKGSILLLFAATSWIVMGLLRGALLTIDDGLHFNLITILPTLTIFIISSCTIISDLSIKDNLEVIFSIAGGVSLTITIIIIRKRLFQYPDSSRPLGIRKLITQGADVFFQTASSSLQVYLCFRLFSETSSFAEVGHLSIVIIVLNALIFPLQSVSPILLNRWSKERSLTNNFTTPTQLYTIAFLIFIISLVIITTVQTISPLFLDIKEAPSTRLWLILLSLGPMTIVRISALRLASVGEFRFNSLVAIGQLFFFYTCFTIVVNFGILDANSSIILSWVAADCLSATIYSLKNYSLVRNSNTRES